MVMVDNLMITEERKKEIEDNHGRDEKKAKKETEIDTYLWYEDVKRKGKQ